MKKKDRESKNRRIACREIERQIILAMRTTWISPEACGLPNSTIYTLAALETARRKLNGS